MSVNRQMAQQETMSRLMHTVRMSKKTVNMDPKEEQYWMHFLSKDPLVGDYIRSQFQHNPQLRREVLNQPVCVKCEKFCFYHNDGVMCPSCGHWSRDKVKLKSHIKTGGYK